MHGQAAGAFVATYLGQALGLYRAHERAGLIGAVVGAIVVLVIWGAFARTSASSIGPTPAVGTIGDNCH
jgi:Transglycosylase associated protein